ncbi:MAG: hypothetical protein H6707_17180 [Deltaproteobacteria bacterium]|nr:hypothetical protein [Deltaproteobacteria bacterium]
MICNAAVAGTPGKPRQVGDTVHAPAVPAAVSASNRSQTRFGEPIHYHNITIVPVETTDRGPYQHYTLLEEGLRAKTFAVRELAGQSGQARVGHVEVKNSGQHPVYLVGGEMILGGKQDRIISQDTIVDNGGGWMKVGVFCVEQGRWTGQNMRFSAGSAIAHVALRKAARSGSQSEVWKAVAAKNRQQGTQSSTQTYRRTIQNAKVREKIAPYRRAVTSKLPKSSSLAGLVFAVNGRVRVADIFGNPLLFSAIRDKLLSAYILEALGTQVDRHAKPLSKDGAQGWVTKASTSKRHMKQVTSGRAINQTYDNDDAIGAEAVDKKTGKTVRKSYYAH